MPLPVLPALFKELAIERRKAKRSQQEIADTLGVRVETVERWEKQTSLPLRKSEGAPGADLARPHALPALEGCPSSGETGKENLRSNPQAAYEETELGCETSETPAASSANALASSAK
jgi:hypothetical protein